jgi:hypothetical protein
MKRDYRAAWGWYEDAARDRAAARPEPEKRRTGWDVAGPRPFRDVSFFEYYCLDKLGRHREAAARLAEFRVAARRLLPTDEELDTFPLLFGTDEKKFKAWMRGEMRSLAPLARDFYCAEVFLSLDAAADGEAFFRKLLAEAANDDDRLSAAVVLAQLLALQGRADDFADVVTESLAPLAVNSLPPPEAGKWFAPPIPVWLAGLTVMPLATDDVVARLSDERAARWAACCERLRKLVKHDEVRLLADVLLEKAYNRLGREREKREAQARQRENPGFNPGGWQNGNLPKWDHGTKADAQARSDVERSGLLGMILVRAWVESAEPAGNGR